MAAPNPYRDRQANTATPGQLVVMLFDGAVTALDRASQAIADGKLDVANAELCRAQDIVTELQVSLNREAGGQIASNLNSLYTFCAGQLVRANLTKDAELIAPVRQILADLGDAFTQAGRNDDAESAAG